MDLKTNCLLCRVSVQNYVNTGHYIHWIEDVTTSVCRVLQLDQYFQILLETAVYCNSCLFTLRDIDLTLKNISGLQRRLETDRLRVITLLGDNFDELGGDDEIETILGLNDNEDVQNSYEGLIKSIWESLSADKKPFSFEINCSGSEVAQKVGRYSDSHQNKTILREAQELCDQSSDSEYLPDTHESHNLNMEIEVAHRSLRKRKKLPPVRVRRGQEGNYVKKKKINQAGLEKSKSEADKLSSNSENNKAKETSCRCRCGDAFISRLLLKEHQKNICPITHPGAIVNESSNLIDFIHDGSESEKPKLQRKRTSRDNSKPKTAKTKYSNAKKFKCKECSFAVNNETRFQVHCRIHDGDETPYHCDLCKEAKFTCNNALYDHKRRNCPANTTTRRNRKNTIRKPNNGDGDRACRTRTQFRLESETDESEYGEENVDKTEFKCSSEDCTFSTTSERRYQCHVRVHEGDPLPYWCNSCDKKFPKAKHLNLHKHRNCGDVFTCPTPNCDSVFPNRYVVKAHMSTFHYNDGKHICQQCSKVFESSEEEFYKEHLRTHKVRETDGRKFSCIVLDCDAIFLNSVDLKAHVLDQHETTSSKCDICQAVLANPTSLKRHMLEQHVPPNYSLKCEQCPFVAKHPSRLKIHMSKHSETKRYACKVEGCDKEFTWANSLRTHMMNHTGVRKFKCTFENCTKAFISSTKLRDHEETHSDRRSYICDLCAKAFKAKKNLKQHFRYVHNVGVTRVKENRQKRKLLEQGEGSSGQKSKTKKKMQSASKYVMKNPSYQQESDSAEDQEIDEDALDRSTVDITLGSGNWSSPQQRSAHGQQFLNPLFHPMNNSSLYFNN